MFKIVDKTLSTVTKHIQIFYSHICLAVLSFKTELRADQVSFIFSVFLTENWNAQKFSYRGDSLSIILKLLHNSRFVKQCICWHHHLNQWCNLTATSASLQLQHWLTIWQPTDEGKSPSSAKLRIQKSQVQSSLTYAWPRLAQSLSTDSLREDICSLLSMPPFYYLASNDL